MPADKTVTMNLEVTGVEEATERFERLAKAIERTVEAMNGLNGQPHGGIEVKMVGNLMHVAVKPFVQAA